MSSNCTRTRGSRRARILIAIAAAAALAACGKASDKISEKVSERVAEKLIESSIAKDGSTAKVDLSKGQATITRTDEKGNTTVMEYGGAKVTEADLGVKLYPGATASRGGATRATTAEGTTVIAAYESKDNVEKVAGFFRDQLRAKSGGKQFADSINNDSAMLMLTDEQGNNVIHVAVNKADEGSTIQIMATQKASE